MSCAKDKKNKVKAKPGKFKCKKCGAVSDTKKKLCKAEKIK